MPKMANRLVLLALFLALATSTARADDDDGKMAQLCASGTEGTAQGTMEKLGAVRLNLICIDKGRMAGSSYLPGLPFISMTFSAIDDGSLVLSQFPLGGDDRKGIAAGTNMNYVRVNLDGLAAGSARGFLVGGTLTTPLGFTGQLTQRYPSVAKMVSKPISRADFSGTYSFQLIETMGKDKGKADNALLWADLIQGVPTFTLGIGAAVDAAPGKPPTAPYVTMHFVDGPAWDGKTGFESTNAIGDTTATGSPLWHIRGRVLENGLLEIYLIDSMHGLRGPFQAKKVRDPRGLLNAQ